MATTIQIEFECGWIFKAPLSLKPTQTALHQPAVVDTVSKIAELAHQQAHPDCEE